LNGPDPTMIRPFLSYAHEDRLRVRDLYDKLKAVGFDPWLDDEHLRGGQTWELEIKKAIKSCDFFIACLSSKSVNKRGFVQKELKQALEFVDEFPEGQVFVVPVKLSGSGKLRDSGTIRHGHTRARTD
jgi:hypothetical protein